MSDTTAAFVVVPLLILLTLALECTRIGCSRMYRFFRPPAPLEEPGRSREDMS